MLRKLKENKKGFTLAELLIVVAIIGVLVAVSIPIFTAQLEKSRLATNKANCRSAKAIVVSQYLTAGKEEAIAGNYDVATGKFTVGTPATTPKDTVGTAKVYTTIGLTISADGKKIDFDKTGTADAATNFTSGS